MEKLKVGQSFEVGVMVKPPYLMEDDFDLNKSYLSSQFDGEDYWFYDNNFRLSLIYPREVKLVGKLTITKVK